MRPTICISLFLNPRTIGNPYSNGCYPTSLIVRSSCFPIASKVPCFRLSSSLSPTTNEGVDPPGPLVSSRRTKIRVLRLYGFARHPMTTVLALTSGLGLSWPRRARQTLWRAPYPPSSRHLFRPVVIRIARILSHDQAVATEGSSTRAPLPHTRQDLWIIPQHSVQNRQVYVRNEVTSPLPQVTIILPKKNRIPFQNNTIPPFYPVTL